MRSTIDTGGLDNLVRYFGTPEEAAELRTLRQQASRATELENRRNAQPKAERISTITAIALGMVIAQTGAGYMPTMMREAKHAGRATTRRRPQVHTPVLQLMTAQP